jgi:hypothetical protein
MKSFNEALDELIITLDYGSADTEGFDFHKEGTIRHVLRKIKSHVRILKTLNQYESSKIETEILKDMFTRLSAPDPIKGMTGSNQMYKFLAVITDYICYSKFDCKYHGDKPEEIPMVLDNLTDYIEELFLQSKQRTLDNCKVGKERADKKRLIEFLWVERPFPDDRAI